MQSGARDYYRQVIDSLRCPTLVYKKSPIPSDELLLELAGDPNVVGVKYAENNLHDFRKVVLEDRGRIEWLCGSAERFAPYYMLAGATGYTTGAGNICPHLTLAMHAAFAAGEWSEGMRWQRLILPIEDFRARDGDSFNIWMLKYAMRRVEADFGAPACSAAAAYDARTSRHRRRTGPDPGRRARTAAGSRDSGALERRDMNRPRERNDRVYCMSDPLEKLADDAIVAHIRFGSRVLDLGCGDGRS